MMRTFSTIGTVGPNLIPSDAEPGSTIMMDVMPKEYVLAAVNTDDTVTMNNGYIALLSEKEQDQETNRVQSNFTKLLEKQKRSEAGNV